MTLNTTLDKWQQIFEKGGPRNFYPHSYVVSWYFRNVHQNLIFSERKKVLDIGCGTSPDLYLFASMGFEYYGADVTDVCFEEILKTANERRLDTKRILLNTFIPPKLPYADDFFDIVVGLESIHFNSTAESMQQFIDEIYRVMSPKSYFFFSTIDKGHYFVLTKYSKFLSETCLEIQKGFPENKRSGLKYYVFKDENEIKYYFKRFNNVRVGRYLLDTKDNQPDSYYLIYGSK